LTGLVIKMIKTPYKRLDLKKYSHIKYLLFIPVYMVIFMLEEKLITHHYFVSYLPLDSMIPFCEWFVIPYVLWYPLMLGTGVYLFFKDPEGFKNYMYFIGGGFLLIVLFYAAFPNGQNLRPHVFTRSNILIDFVKALYQSDTNTNVLPSLHVVGTMGAMFALLKCSRLRKFWFRLFIVVLSISICISTVYIKQHSILDLFTGVPLAFVYYLIVYKLLPNRQKSFHLHQKSLHI